MKIILFMGFWLIAGLAYQTGVDWKVYANIFEQVLPIDQAFINDSFHGNDLRNTTEPGYSFLLSLVMTFTNEYQIVQLLMQFIASIFFFKALSKYTCNYLIVLLLYLGYVYLTLNMSGIRQALSLSIFFYALKFIEQKRFWHYLFFILLASSFHYSAFILLPLYWVLNKKISTKLISFLLSIGLVIYIVQISVISNVIESMTSAAGGHIVYRLYLYVTGAQDVQPGISLKMLLHVILFVLLLLRRNTLIEQNKYSNIFINLFLMYILIGQYMWDTGDIMIRIQLYFIMGLVIMMPIYVDSLRYKGNKIILTSFIFLLSVWSSNPIFLELPNGLPYNPYQNYILHKITDKQSTGDDRLKEWISKNE